MEGKENISVIGLGHVGLPTALGLAEFGWEVTGVDEDRKKIALITISTIGTSPTALRKPNPIKAELGFPF